MAALPVVITHPMKNTATYIELRQIDNPEYICKSGMHKEPNQVFKMGQGFADITLRNLCVTKWDVNPNLKMQRGY